MPGPRDIGLGEAELHARGDSDLLLDQIDPRDGLGDWMLHLKARVDLEEEELAVAEHELDGARIHIAGGGHRANRRLAHRGANLSADRGRGRLFDDLLVPALYRAFTFAEMDGVTVLVTDDLDLDMTRLANVALEVHGWISER